MKIEDQNRSAVELNSQKSRLQMEAQESNKKLNEFKLAMEHAGMDKNKFASQIEELRQIKINLEGTIVKWQAENADWKKKYENEARLRVEETDALKKKFTIEINGLTDACHNLEQKLKATEGAKLTLSSEVGVLIKDFEHSQVVIKELTSKLQLSDKTCNDLSIKLKEMTNLYERADKDNKARGNEIVKLNNDMDRLAMGNQTLTQ